MPDPRPDPAVAGWIGRRTHHWDDWALADLAAAKGDRVVSLVVPARNEAATVGAVVERVRDALVDTVELLDEIVVIDSDSTDDTYAVATDAGATVHRSAEIRPDLGTLPGQGRGDVEVALRHVGRAHRLHGRRPGRLGHPLRPRPARPAADHARGRAGQGLLRAADALRRRRGAVRGWPGDRAGRPPADPAALPRARRPAPAAGGRVGRTPLALRAARTSRTATPSSWPRSSTPSGAGASTRSPRSTSAPAPTGTSRCATSGGMSTQILAAALARVGAGPRSRSGRRR